MAFLLIVSLYPPDPTIAPRQWQRSNIQPYLTTKISLDT